LPRFIAGVAVAGLPRARHIKGNRRYRGFRPHNDDRDPCPDAQDLAIKRTGSRRVLTWAAPNRVRDNPRSDSGRPLMWRTHNINSLRDMSRIKRYLIPIGLVFFGLVFVLGLFGATWLSAY